MPDFRQRPRQANTGVQMGRPATERDYSQQTAQQLRGASDAATLNARIDALSAELDQVQDSAFVVLAHSSALASERELAAGADIEFQDGGPKASLSFKLTLTGIAPGTYGAALKIPVIQFDDKGRAVAAAEISLGTAAALDSDNDPTLAANSNSRLATQAAVKAFVENAVAGLLDFKGNIDCSPNPNYAAALKGDAYLVSVAGKIGGAAGITVEVGDVVVASADNAGGTHAAVGASWFILEHNLQGALQSANNLGDVPSPSTARTNLGLAIGTNVQAYDADLAAIAALVTTNFGRTFLTLADQAAALAHIGALAASAYSSGTWSPVVTAGSGAITAYSATGEYTRIGNIVVASVDIDISNNGSGGALVNFTLPFASSSTIRKTGSGREANATGNQLQVFIDPSGAVASILNYNNSYPGGTGYKLVATVIYVA